MPKFDINNSFSMVTNKHTAASIINENKVPETLSALEEEIKILKNNLQRNIWLLGQRLSKINEEKLYENDDLKTFEEYCEKKLDFSRAVAYRFIKIYKTFDFVSTSRHDYSKLEEVAKIQSDKKRKELLERMETENLSVRKLREIIKEIKNKPQKLLPQKNKNTETYFEYKIRNNIILVRVLDEGINKKELLEKLKIFLEEYRNTI